MKNVQSTKKKVSRETIYVVVRCEQDEPSQLVRGFRGRGAKRRAEQMRNDLNLDTATICSFAAYEVQTLEVEDLNVVC